MAQTEKTVLIIGGGVAGLAAAVALVESNKLANPVKFKIHIITQAHRWGGKASSWRGGQKGPHAGVDFTCWPPDFTLNHGFHAVFDQSTYRNFWYTLRQAWGDPRSRPEKSLEELLYPNRHEILVYENYPPPQQSGRICRLQVHPGLLLPGSQLLRSGAAQLFSGTWSLTELLSFRDVVIREVLKIVTFQQLQAVDEKVDHVSGKKYCDIDFTEWCLGRCIKESVTKKQLFEFIFDASYVSPFKMDTASALRALWILLRDYRSTQWYYLQGGYTEHLFDPVDHYLHANGSGCTMLVELLQFIASPDKKRITGYKARQVEDHEDSSQPREEPSPETLAKYKALGDKLHGMIRGFQEQCMCTPPPPQADYYICTLPVGNFWPVIQASGMEADFPNIGKLAKAPNVGTVNLQAWFSRRVTPPHLKNVVAGFEPLCVMVDYKNFLPMYQDDHEWPGSVIEVNGSEEELKEAFPEKATKFFGDPKPKIGIEPVGKQPTDEARIQFAREILLKFASDYGFDELKKAVEEDTFLEKDDWPNRTRWKGKKIPPFLWYNVHKHNAFFVTELGLLHLRPRTRTPYSNLFLAGDWIRNGMDIPCMEGAARSGRMAARAVQEEAGCRDLINVFDPD
jgi:hypothetical protein